MTLCAACTLTSLCQALKQKVRGLLFSFILIVCIYYIIIESLNHDVGLNFYPKA